MDIQQVSGPPKSIVMPGGATPRPPTDRGVLEAAAQPASQAVRTGTSQGRAQIERTVEEINRTIQVFARDLEFTVDPQTHNTIVKVIDRQTKEVLRQMPSEEALAIAHALDKLQGLMIKQKA